MAEGDINRSRLMLEELLKSCVTTRKCFGNDLKAPRALSKLLGIVEVLPPALATLSTDSDVKIMMRNKQYAEKTKYRIELTYQLLALEGHEEHTRQTFEKKYLFVNASLVETRLF
jgi:hypothetical protein